MENTKTNAIKFFGAYINCEAKCHAARFHPSRHAINKDGKLIMSPSILADIWEGTFRCSDFSLLLRPLSSITDEDAKELSYRIGSIVDLNQRIMTNSVELVKEVIDNYTKVSLMWMLPARFTDKARELGYAIEWNEVSVEKQIEYGWIKLKH